MKLTIERAALLKALAHVQSVVERRNTIPILSNVLITAQKGRLSLAATDMDLAITEAVDASAAKTGASGADDERHRRRSAVLAKLVIELVLMTAIEALHGDRPCSTLVL